MAKKAAQLDREIAAALSTPVDDTIDAATFRRAYAATLRRYGKAFQALADFDRGIVR